jgi:hypothetical protein
MNTIFFKNSNISCEEINDGLILLNEETGEIHILNEVAKFLYEHTDNITSIDMIINELVKVCEISKENVNEVYQDCENWFNDMLKKDVFLSCKQEGD